MKKIISMLLAMIMTMSMCNVFAYENETTENEQDNATTISIQSIPEGATPDEKQTIIDETLDELSTNDKTRSSSKAYAMIFRSGNTSSCELYLGWNGNIMFSMWAFDLFQVKSTSILNPVRYANIGGFTVYCNASTVGTAKVYDINVPSNVNTVHIDVDDLKGYAITQAVWVKAKISGSKVDIN